VANAAERIGRRREWMLARNEQHHVGALEDETLDLRRLDERPEHDHVRGAAEKHLDERVHRARLILTVRCG